MIESLHDQPTPGRMTLKIGALDTIPKHLTVRLVTHALRTRGCSVSVVEGRPEFLLKELTEHRIDLVVTNFFPLEQPGQIQIKRISELPLWIVGGKKFLKLKRGFPNSLDRQPFILPTKDSHVRHEFENYCLRSKIKPDQLVEAQDMMVQKLLALEEQGLTVMPEFAIREPLKERKLFLIGALENMSEELFLISASRRIENPVAATLMKDFQIPAGRSG
jgi:LysR family transcriptional activator of nhaA